MENKKNKRGEIPDERGKSLYKNILEAREQAAFRELRRFSYLDSESTALNNMAGPMAQGLIEENLSDGSSDNT